MDINESGNDVAIAESSWLRCILCLNCCSFLTKCCRDEDQQSLLPNRSQSKWYDSHTEQPKKLTGPTQFGVSLQMIIQHVDNQPVPYVIRICIEYLDNEKRLEEEGLFRISASTKLINQTVHSFDKNKTVSFDFNENNHVHLAANLLKKYLRELPEPLLTFGLNDYVLNFYSIANDLDKLAFATSLLVERLPEYNYQILHYLMAFLTKVMEKSDRNKMNASNLARVFAPSLMWQGHSIQSIKEINESTQAFIYFVEYLLTNCEQIFN